MQVQTPLETIYSNNISQYTIIIYCYDHSSSKNIVIHHTHGLNASKASLQSSFSVSDPSSAHGFSSDIYHHENKASRCFFASSSLSCTLARARLSHGILKLSVPMIPLPDAHHSDETLHCASLNNDACTASRTS